MFSFHQQPSLAEHLQLSQYSCKNVNISFAAVNKNGRSSYSSLKSFCIGGGKNNHCDYNKEHYYKERMHCLCWSQCYYCGLLADYHYPQQVTQVNFEYSEDHRLEFLAHAIANISWEKPAGVLI